MYRVTVADAEQLDADDKQQDARCDHGCLNQAARGHEAVPPNGSADHREAARSRDERVAETERLGFYDEDRQAIREALKEARAERGRT